MNSEYLRYFYLSLAVTLTGIATIVKMQCTKHRDNPALLAPAVQNNGTLEFFEVGRSVGHFDEYEMRMFMREYGFKNLQHVKLPMLRRIYLAYSYKQMYKDMSASTGLGEGIIFAFHIFESTINGIETDLFAQHKNPGGIKYKGQGYKVRWYDDCYDESGKSIPCEFEGFNSYQDMLSAWSLVLNAERYAPCKELSDVRSICKCLQDSGYHTADSYKQRAFLAKQYASLHKYFPIP